MATVAISKRHFFLDHPVVNVILSKYYCLLSFWYVQYCKKNEVPVLYTCNTEKNTVFTNLENYLFIVHLIGHGSLLWVLYKILWHRIEKTFWKEINNILIIGAHVSAKYEIVVKVLVHHFYELKKLRSGLNTFVLFCILSFIYSVSFPSCLFFS